MFVLSAMTVSSGALPGRTLQLSVDYGVVQSTDWFSNSLKGVELTGIEVGVVFADEGLRSRVRSLSGMLLVNITFVSPKLNLSAYGERHPHTPSNAPAISSLL